MKSKLTLSLFLAVLLSACSSMKTTTTTSTMSMDPKAGRYANDSMEAAPPAEGPEADIPTEGPADVNLNPAYMPSPLLRNMAAGGP
jgi:hypothetical protein